jgi:hypothetical protein
LELAELALLGVGEELLSGHIDVCSGHAHYDATWPATPIAQQTNAITGATICSTGPYRDEPR